MSRKRELAKRRGSSEAIKKAKALLERSEAGDVPLAMLTIFESMSDRLERIEDALVDLAEIGMSEHRRRRRARDADDREAREQGEGPEIDRDLF